MKIPALQAVTVEILVDNFFDVFEPSRPGIVERVIPGRPQRNRCWRPTDWLTSSP